MTKFLKHFRNSLIIHFLDQLGQLVISHSEPCGVPDRLDFKIVQMAVSLSDPRFS